MAEDALTRFVSTEIAKRGWSRADLGRESGLNKNTLTDFFNGRSTPARRALTRIEAASGLTSGTLADTEGQPRVDLTWPASTKLLDEGLLAELAYRMQTLKREVGRRRALQSKDEGVIGGGGEVTHIRPTGAYRDQAVRTGSNGGQHIDEAMGAAREENQDPWP